MIRGKDIAEMVGVSRQAVTAVLNGSRPNCVSREKREAILKIAAEHNYHPDHAAVALKTGRSNLIGVVMPPLENIYISELCMAIYHSIIKHKYVPLFTFFDLRNPSPEYSEQLLAQHVTGMISVQTSYLPDSINIPVVSYYYDDQRFDSVCPDLECDITQIVDHLMATGHSKIGYLGFTKDRRFPLLTAILAQRGIEFPERFCAIIKNNDIGGAFDLLLEQNSGKDLPTVLLAHNDTMAMSLVRRINERGYKIPDDFSIIGHDNIAACQNMIPALTSVSFGTPEEIAEKLVKQLLHRLKHPKAPRAKAVLEPKLVIRESVKTLK